MTVSWRESFSNFVIKLDPETAIAEERFKNSVERELGPIEELEKKVHSLVQELSLRPPEEARDLFLKLELLSNSPNPHIKNLFTQLYWQDENHKCFLIEFADEKTVALTPYERYLLVNRSEAISSLLSGKFKETEEGCTSLNISSKAFGQVIQDLRRKDSSFFEDETTLLERAIFCKEYGLNPLSRVYEDELCRLAKNQTIKEIIDLSALESDLPKLEEVYRDRISEYLVSAIYDSNPQALEEALDSLSPYAEKIRDLNLKWDYPLSHENFKQIIQRFPHLHSLALYGHKLNEKSIEVIATLSELKSLMLDCCPKTTPKAFTTLSTLQELSSLSFTTYCEITDDDLEDLCFVNLKILDLSGTSKITGKGLKHICERKLESLVVNCGQILEADGLESLLVFDKLTSLNVDYLNLTDAHLMSLSILSELRSLSLSGCTKITDEGVKHFSNLEKLESLNLSECNIKGYCLEDLSSLPLNWLDLRQAVTSENVRFLSKFTRLTYLRMHAQNESLKYISELTTLRDLNVAGSYSMESDELESLSQLTNLHSLNLCGCHIDDESLKSLSCLKSLNSLNLRDGSLLTGSGLKYLSHLPNLSVDLNGCKGVNDEALKSLVGLNNLRSLNLSGCGGVTGKALKHLSGLNLLNSLDLRFLPEITDENLKELSKLINLTSLVVGSKKITDKGLRSFSTLTQLDHLDLSGCENITNEGLKAFSKLTKLNFLGLSFCKRITEDGFKNLSGRFWKYDDPEMEKQGVKSWRRAAAFS